MKPHRTGLQELTNSEILPVVHYHGVEKRVPRRRIIVIGLTIAAIAVGLLIAPWCSRTIAHRKSIAVLGAAVTLPELAHAAEGGGFLPLAHIPRVSSSADSASSPATEWVAIRYTDSHSPLDAFSLAIARCSDGTWFESREHFCGMLSPAITRARALAAAQSPTERAAVDQHYHEGRHRWVEEITEAATINEAKAVLVRVGFRPIHGP